MAPLEKESTAFNHDHTPNHHNAVVETFSDPAKDRKRRFRLFVTIRWSPGFSRSGTKLFVRLFQNRPKANLQRLRVWEIFDQPNEGSHHRSSRTCIAMGFGRIGERRARDVDVDPRNIADELLQ